jgi:hypothetical protein
LRRSPRPPNAFEKIPEIAASPSFGSSEIDDDDA